MSEASVWVPSGEGDAARIALPIARELARLQHATVHLVQAAGAQPVEVADDVLVHDVEGDPTSTVLEAAGDAALIVTSTRDALDPPDVALGRAAWALLASARCPVVLVRPEDASRRWELEELLVPHDGTPGTTAAICPAAELARKIGARLFAIHVAAPGAARPEEPGSLQVPHYVDQPQHEWPAWAGEFLERVRSRCPVDLSKARFFMGHGEPASEIVRMAREKEVDLIVLAWHGTLEDEHAKVFKELLRASPCPMMVLRVEPDGAHAMPSAAHPPEPGG